MDLNARKHLIDDIHRQSGEIAVPLDLFFTCNDDQGSIGSNLGAKQPEIATFYQMLSALRDRKEVQDIWIRIIDAEDPSYWPYTDTAYVITALTEEELRQTLSPLCFDTISPH